VGSPGVGVAARASSRDRSRAGGTRVRLREGHRFSAAFSAEAAASSSSSPSDDDDAPVAADDDEPPAPPKEEVEFQAETRQLLDIVTHSLYTDKEVFLRELVSNASDALEKLRHVQATGTLSGTGSSDGEAGSVPLEIRIETDEAANTLTIADTGIGMTREEMTDNLGTIARSGTKSFVTEMKRKKDADDPGDFDPFGQGIIGKFGVGFYSGFMVADKVDVRSMSAGKISRSGDAFEGGKEEEALVWESTGSGKYSIAPLSGDVRQDRGTSVVLHLKPDLEQFVDEKTVEGILKKYSNFVGFPIYLNGNRVNTVDAVWLDHPKDVTEETHSSFYKYVAHAHDEPLSTIHFRVDAPLDIKALFYIPSFHQEKHGMGRMDPGVSLYSRKVLIESKSPDILPEWCRFVKGVVDSEDLPLSISREKPQDTALMHKMRKALTRKVIAHLAKMMKKDPTKYKEEFYGEYAFFLKEGACQDFDSQEPLSKLLMFETSKGMAGELSSLDEYVSRMPPEQKDVYFLFAPSRELALQSPYMEGFAEGNREVLFVYSAIDDFVMANLKAFEGRNLVSVDRSEVDLPKKDADEKKDDKNESKGDEDKAASSGTSLSKAEAADFCAWFQSTLGSKVSTCRTTDRLTSSPAVVTDAESGALRRMMRMVETQEGGAGSAGMPLPKQIVEINPRHEIVRGMHALKDADPTLAKVLAEQVYDNCLVAAGLLDDGRSMLPRLNDLMLCVVKTGQKEGGSDGAEKAAELEMKGKDSEEVANEPKVVVEPEIVEAEFVEPEFVEPEVVEAEVVGDGKGEGDNKNK
ncbi:hypothetical protein ACHAWF_004859, partial [Thalassiosira exigua]